MSHVMNTYARQPVAFVRGQGVWLWDDAGKKYLDALAGIAVNTLGHNHPRLTRALTEQIGRIIHCSNLFQNPLQEQAADRIAEITGLDEVFFCNSGLEANEAAIKVARKYGHDRGIAEPAIIVMEKAFHGRSLATLSATASRKVQAGFEPLVQGFVRVPLNDLDAVRQVAAHNKNVVAIFVEPIQGEGGINVSRMEYLKGLKEICDKHEWLFMSDEIQCGLGRTGKWFVYQHAGFLPDVVPMAKGLAGGPAVGACVLGGRARGVFKPGNHGSTFGGNPLAMCGVITTIDTMKDEGLLENAAKVGAAMKAGLTAALGGLPGVVEVRGMGLMLGIELERPCGELVKQGLDAGLVFNVTADNVVRLLPPLVISEAEGREVVERLVPLVKAFLAQGSSQPKLSPRAEPAMASVKKPPLRHFLQFSDFSRAEYEYLFARTRWIKERFKRYQRYWPLEDRTLAMIFEKQSTRTRLSFEAGMHQLGGTAIFLNTRDSQLGRGEPVEDAAQVISRMCDLVMIRTFEQKIIERFAGDSRVPVINGLTNEYHPCQILADVYTFIEQRGPIKGRTVAWIGDSNNMCMTWLQAASIFDFKLNVSTPPGYELRKRKSANHAFFADPVAAARGADLVTTDVWTSMGFESENTKRKKAFAGWQVNARIMKAAKKDALFMHCLPAHRGEEVSAGVIDGRQSVVWDEAENRLHTQKALMEFLLLGRVKA